MITNEKIKQIFSKFKIEEKDFNININYLLDSLQIIKLSLEIEKEFNIKIFLNNETKVIDIYNEIFK